MHVTSWGRIFHIAAQLSQDSIRCNSMGKQGMCKQSIQGMHFHLFIRDLPIASQLAGLCLTLLAWALQASALQDLTLSVILCGVAAS